MSGIFERSRAEVAELVYALRSGRSSLTGLRVQISPSALFFLIFYLEREIADSAYHNAFLEKRNGTYNLNGYSSIFAYSFKFIKKWTGHLLALIIN